MNKYKSGFFSLFLILSIFALLAGCSRGPTSAEGDGGGTGPVPGAGKLSGTFDANYNADLSMCSNSANNGSFTGTGTITFGGGVNITLVHTRSDGVINMTSSIAFSNDSVADDGSITGDFSEAFTMVGAALPAWSGSGTISGTKSGEVMVIDFTGNGDNACMLTGTLVLSPPMGVPPVTLSRITVTPNNRTIASGATLQFAAVATYSDGANVDVTSQASWSSSMGAVATISDVAPSKGLATAAAVTVTGSTAIQATFGGVSGTTRLTVAVTAPTLDQIQVTPSTASISVDTTQQFIATAIYSNSTSQDVTSLAIWTSSQPGIASVGNLATDKGLALAISVSATPTTIQAAFGGLSGTATLTVTQAVLTSIEVSPLSTSVAVNASVQFSATGVYSDNTKQDLTSQVDWTSGNDIVATVSNVAATKGLATGVLVVPNPIFITATDPATTISGAGSLQVTPALTITAITILPAVASVPVTLTQAFTATATYDDLSTGDVTSEVLWSSSNIAAIISNDPGSNGVATGITAGVTVNISAAHPDYPALVIAPASLTVTAAGIVSISVTPTTASITVGGTQQYAATATFTDGTTTDVTNSVTWFSSDSTIAVISNALGEQGLATGVAANANPVDIWAEDPVSGVISNLAALTVTGVASIAILPANQQTIFTGTNLQYAAMATLTDGTPLDVTAEVIWSSSDTAVAVISNALGTEGLATGTAVMAGTTAISAVYQPDPTATPVVATPVSLTVLPLFMENFEAGGAGWSFVPDSVPVWAIGTVVPAAGPGPGGGGGGGGMGGASPTACFAGTQCVGTVLGGAYPVIAGGVSVDDLLRSPEISLAPVATGDEIHLQFQQWVSYLAGDQGQLWIWDVAVQQWVQLTPPFIVSGLAGPGGTWQAIDLNLTAYAGRTIILGFQHSVTNTAGSAAGWYIDNVEFVVVTP